MTQKVTKQAAVFCARIRFQSILCFIYCDNRKSNENSIEWCYCDKEKFKEHFRNCVGDKELLKILKLHWIRIKIDRI